MKKLTKIMALVLCMAMVFALCACGKSDSEKFVGTWETEIDLSDVAIASLEAEIGDAMDYFDFGKLISVATFNFNEDGTYKMTMKLDDKSLDEFNTVLEDGLMAMMYDATNEELAAYGMTMEEGDAAYLETYGMTIEEYNELYVEAFMEEMDIQQLFADSSVEGNWKVEDGKLYMTEDIDETEFDAGDYDVYKELTESSFTIVEEYVNGEKDEANMYPMVFTKVG